MTTDHLLNYLLAGAKLTGFKVSRHALPGASNGVLLIQRPEVVDANGAWAYFASTKRTDADVEWQCAFANTGYALRDDRWLPSAHTPLLGGLLRTLQPDMATSRSVQHYIDTGFYLPVRDTRNDDETRF